MDDGDPMFYTILKRKPGQPLGMGLGLMDGRVVVTTVDAGSPAEKANLIEGDCLVSVNDVPLTPQNIGFSTTVLEFELGVNRDMDLLDELPED